MDFASRYESHPWDSQYHVNYTEEEHQTWHFLYQRQIQILEGRAVPQYIEGLQKLAFSQTHIPQIAQVNQALQSYTHWQVRPVQCVISSEEFFKMLSQAHFPVATFIRRAEDMDYITEPDIFHELFGHIPLYTVPEYAYFVQSYAKRALTYPKKDWNLFLRLFWFTVEFGLIQTAEGMRIYGGGILSSYKETLTCLNRDDALRAYFEPVSILRTGYRIDVLQNIYYVIADFKELFQMIDIDFGAMIARAQSLGEFPAFYPPKNLEDGQKSNKANQ